MLASLASARNSQPLEGADDGTTADVTEGGDGTPHLLSECRE